MMYSIKTGGKINSVEIKRHRIQFPKFDVNNLSQSETYFYIIENGGDKIKLKFHDYDKIYNIPGLYEQLFYDRLKCTSPNKVADILKKAVDQSNEDFFGLRVLDLGAGNGMVGEALKKYGVSRLVGVDIIPEAKQAMERDRPQYYDAYYISDFCNIESDAYDEFVSWSLDCLTTVAALGFGDIPPKAFMNAFNIINQKGWIGFNIKESFLDERDQSGFSRMIRDLILSKYLDIYHLERYQHRLSIDGNPLFYFAIAGKKNADIPVEYFEKYLDDSE
jgi:SAM-dependent methyltransferase